MGKIIFILGGARSGKSRYAVALARKCKKVAFIATCRPLDKEMRQRIILHQKARPKYWRTYEEFQDIPSLLMKMGNAFDCIIIDCLTLLVSNLILDGSKEEKIMSKINAILVALNNKKAKVIIIANEVGLGVVPANRLGRDFRDIAGRVNQLVAKESSDIFFIVAGIPTRIKGDK